MAPFRSIRVRLTLWYVLLLAVILAVFSAGVYVALRYSLYGNLDDTLDTRATAFITVATADGGSPHLTLSDAPNDPNEEAFVRLFDTSGKVTFDNTGPDEAAAVDQSAVQHALQGDPTRTSTSSATEDLRILTTPIRSGGQVVGVLQVGISEGDVHDTLRVLLIIIAIAYPLTLLVASAGGVFLAGRALKPIAELTAVAEQIGAEDLSRRIDSQLPDDEVGHLARTFNDMIARLDEAFRRQRQFTADASHELRTPLTAIKGQTEVALQADRDPVEYRRVLTTVKSEVDRMIRLVGSLLSLARADAGQVRLARDDVDLAQLAADAVEQIAPAAAVKNIDVEIRASAPLRATADEDLLLQLLLNLLDNAVKYTPERGFVGVGCVRGERRRCRPRIGYRRRYRP